MLAAVRALKRLELVRETMRHTLDILADVVPDWLRAQAHAEWVKRYQLRSDEYRLPKSQGAQRELADQIGRDGEGLLDAIYSSAGTPDWLREVPVVELLRQVWVQNYAQTEEGIHWRADDDIPPSAQFLSSPHDPDAHLSKKGSTCWVGY